MTQFESSRATVHIVGAGLAGSEAAWQVASQGVRVMLHEMRPHRMTAAHRTDGLLVVEIEPRDDAVVEPPSRTRLALRALQGASTQVELTGLLAQEVRRVTGFDRVMVYRFDPEWNGEVVAEDRSADLEPFLGLRFPAGDIPAQARALYATNWMRIIPDARYRPVPLDPPVMKATGLMRPSGTAAGGRRAARRARR